MSHNKTITVTLSECHNKPVTIIEGDIVCDYCFEKCDTYNTVEKYFDEIKFDDERFERAEAKEKC